MFGSRSDCRKNSIGHEMKMAANGDKLWCSVLTASVGSLSPEIGVEFILSSILVSENRLIPVNGETAVRHVDERPWECTI